MMPDKRKTETMCISLMMKTQTLLALRSKRMRVEEREGGEEGVTTSPAKVPTRQTNRDPIGADRGEGEGVEGEGEWVGEEEGEWVGEEEEEEEGEGEEEGGEEEEGWWGGEDVGGAGEEGGGATGISA